MNTPIITDMGLVLDSNPSHLDNLRRGNFERSVLLEHRLNPDHWGHITNVPTFSRRFAKYKLREMCEAIRGKTPTVRVLEPACSQSGYATLEGYHGVYKRHT